MNISDPKIESTVQPTVQSTIAPLWRMPFRPFFLGVSLFSGVALLLWVVQFTEGVELGGIGLGWHMHEMIFGFAASTVVGFVLTAAQTWTGVRAPHGNSLKFLFACWLLGRVFWLLPQPFQLLGAAADTAFFLLAGFFIARSILASGNWRNAFFIAIFLLLAGMSVAYGLALFEENYQLGSNLLLITFFLIMHVVLVVGGRVIPLFTDRGLQRTSTEKLVWLEWAALAASLAFLLILIIVGAGLSLRICAALVAGLNLWRWLRWRPWQTSMVPLLWSLHIAYGFVIAGFLFIALDAPRSASLHMLGGGGFGLMILAMISRVSLGHSGRPLKIPNGFSMAYIGIVVAVICRVLAVFLPQHYFPLLWVSLACWWFGYGLFLLRYSGMLLSARADGGAG